MDDGKKTGYDIASILGEMREEYWRGLAEAEARQEETIECLVFRLGGEIFAFETIHASEVLKIPRLIRVPKAQETISGIFNLRGEITAAIDIRPLLGLPQPQIGSLGRLLVVKCAAFATGILVEEVLGVLPLPLHLLEPAVSSLSAGQREFIRGQIMSDTAPTMILDIPRLLASPEIIVDN